jgi:drug/metabolite transporter (DMT)-like permease
MIKLFSPRKNQKATNDNSGAYGVTILAAFLWGTSFIAVELGLESLNPFWFAQFRFLFASMGALVVVVFLKKHIEHRLLFSHWIWFLGLFNALGFIGQFVGQTMTNATKTALLINLNLVTVALLSSLLLNEKLSKLKGLAVLFALIGVFLLTTNGELSQLISGEFMGDMFALAGGFAWAFYIVTNKKVIIQPGRDVVTLTACVMLATTVVLLPFSIFLGGIGSGLFQVSFNNMGYIVYLGIFCNVIPFMLWTYGLKYLTATGSTILLLFEVLIAAILAMIILGEFLTIIGIIGGGFIFSAIILINLKTKRN